MCQYIEIPTHREIKQAIRFMPWGKKVWYYDKETKHIRCGELVGFKTTVYESDSAVIDTWSVFDFSLSNKRNFIAEVSSDKLFLSEKQALAWVMKHTDIQEVVE